MMSPWYLFVVESCMEVNESAQVAVFCRVVIWRWKTEKSGKRVGV
jgi:hypothetical protein